MKLRSDMKYSSSAIMFFVLSSFSLVHADPSKIFEGLTRIKEPLKLRDPFRAPNITLQKKSNIVGKIGNGVYSNIPVLGDVSINDIEVAGVLIGKNRRAFIKIKNKDSEGSGEGETYTIKEGQKLGENDSELKAILPGGIILVEKAINIYGQEEYLETVVPISK